MQADGEEDCSEAALIDRIAAGDRGALQTLYEIYFPRLVPFFTHVSSAPVEELINDTFFDVWQDSDMAVVGESIYVWIMRIALSHARLHGYTAPSAGLTLDQRAVMYLVYTGRAREEVAAIVGVPRGGVDALLSRSRASLTIGATGTI